MARPCWFIYIIIKEEISSVEGRMVCLLYGFIICDLSVPDPRF
jgi:hypothetical protein